MRIVVLTRCTRTDKLAQVRDSIFKHKPTDLDVSWRIIFDTSQIKEISTSIFNEYSSHVLYFWEGVSGDMAHCLLNRAIDLTEDEDWICMIDDDNEMHPNYYTEITKAIKENPTKEIMITSQYVGGRDFSGLEIREAKPENVAVTKIDMGQFTFKKKSFGKKRLIPMTYVADGILIEEVYKEHPEKFHFIDKVLSNYNSLSNEKPYFLPKVLCLGSGNEDMRTAKGADYEDDRLNILSCSANDVIQKIATFNPDCILTVGNIDASSLSLLPADFRLRWMHVDKEDESTGEIAYKVATNYILNTKDHEIATLFTPAYNSKKLLYRTYESLKNQTYDNWEWLLVNDSTDAETIEIIRDIASKDPRVRFYDIKDRSKGIIGESKYRACALSRGTYLIELDHDDYLLPHAVELTVKAFKEFPDAGFVYSDCAEITDSHESLSYGENWGFTYGSYRKETHMGREYLVANTPNVNPMTIRHIVSAPNHLRAWKRDTYFAIGGHNRRLTIADDYELIVRTFLNTKMVKIPYSCYLQFYHGNNSQNAPRADIQRRVRSISWYYNDAIKKRFEELGKEDWVYDHTMLFAVPRKGKEEGHVNYTLEVDKYIKREKVDEQVSSHA